MKNTTTFLRAISTFAVIAIIGFLMAACGDTLSQEENDNGASMPAGLIGRWHSGSDWDAPFMYEFRADGSMIHPAGYSGRMVSARENTLTVSLAGATLGTANFAVYGNQLTLFNIEGMTGLEAGVHFRHDIRFSAAPNSLLLTTAINISFSSPIIGLTANHFVIDGGAITKGDMTGEGTSWSLGIIVEEAGFVDFRINKPGITSLPRAVSVMNTVLPVFKSVSKGRSHSVATAVDGSLWGWGIGDFIGSEAPFSFYVVPIRIGTDTDWFSVSAGGNHTVAIREDGSLWAWGSNWDGQLGDGTWDNRLPVLVPTRIGTDTDWLSVSAGERHSVAIREDGSLWIWGDNRDAQLGDGTTTARNVPTRIGSDTDWLSVSAGGWHTVAIREDGSLWAWGSNRDGQLGDGTWDNRLVPTRIGPDTDWLSVSAGVLHTVAIREDGSLWAWGSNWDGQLGDGTTTYSLVPTRIGTDTDWLSVSAGERHTVAIREDGSLWAWGAANWYDLLGGGTWDNRLVPTRIGTDTDWLSVSAGGGIVAIREDGSLWDWWNWGGQIK
ncbi:MAG: hypothetical protein FWC97_02650 [Treponema sp.]|nr:hypothetical protein [Treponema sp.]